MEDNWEKSFKQLFLSFVIMVISTPSNVYNYLNITDVTQLTFSSLKKSIIRLLFHYPTIHTIYRMTLFLTVCTCADLQFAG